LLYFIFFFVIFNYFFSIIFFFKIILFLFYYKKLSQKRDLENKKKETLAFCFNDKINYESIVIHFMRKSEWQIDNINIFEVLSNFDKISIALKHNIFDENIIYDYYCKYFILFYNEYQYFIIERRNMSSNSDLFIEYEKLVRRWENDFHNLKNIS